MSPLYQFANGLCILVLSFLVIVLSRRQHKLQETVENVRWAAYDLIQHHDRNVKDLQETLVDAGIPMSLKHQEKYLAEMAKPPAQRHAESLQRFNEVVEQTRARFEEDL